MLENVTRNFYLLGYGLTTTTENCKGRENDDGTCDDDDEDDYDESDEEKADPDEDSNEDDDDDDDYDESDEEKADPNSDEDDDDDDYDESDEEKGGMKNDTNINVYVGYDNSHHPYNESSDDDKVHWTYHVYEEYLPTASTPAPSPSFRQDRAATPIILQNTPQYSVFNYYSLNPNSNHQHQV